MREYTVCFRQKIVSVDQLLNGSNGSVNKMMSHKITESYNHKLVELLSTAHCPSGDW